MCPISVFDRLEIATSNEGDVQFACDDPALPLGDDNLVVRAARLFCGEIGLQPHLEITLRKCIPHGADSVAGAATRYRVLGLNTVFQTMLPISTLADMARSWLGCAILHLPICRDLPRARGVVTPVEFRTACPSANQASSACRPVGLPAVERLTGSAGVT
jgi:DNA-binding transcriptional LysR family regulator